MASKKGKLLTCDRCGKTVFLEFLGNNYSDGGYTVNEKFEAAPEGWENHYEIGHLCPTCNAEYKQIRQHFMRMGKVEALEAGYD